MSKLYTLFGAVILICTLANCARDMSSQVHTSSATVGKVLEGTIISARPILIKDSDDLNKNTAGMLAGGALGGVAGSAAGKGTGQALAMVGGAVAGALLGSMAEGKLGQSQGFEYVVRLDPKYVQPKKHVHETKKALTINNSSIENDIKDSITIEDTTTDLISIIQGKDVVLQPNQRVLIIYSDDRPRLVAAQ